MRWLRSLVSCTVSTLLGAAPGYLLYRSGAEPQGIGLLLLGGLIGLAVGLSSVLYEVSPWRTLGRALQGALGVIVGYNAPVNADSLFPADNPSLRRQPARAPLDPRKVESRFLRGLSIGAILGAIAGIPVFCVIPKDTEDEDYAWLGPLLPMLMLVLFCAITAVVGAVWGAGAGLLSVRGPHRPKVLLGLCGGLAIGAALATGLLWNDRGPIMGRFLAFCGLLTTLGLGAGIFNSETMNSLGDGKD